MTKAGDKSRSLSPRHRTVTVSRLTCLTTEMQRYYYYLPSPNPFPQYYCLLFKGTRVAKTTLETKEISNQGAPVAFPQPGQQRYQESELVSGGGRGRVTKINAVALSLKSGRRAATTKLFFRYYARVRCNPLGVQPPLGQAPRRGTPGAVCRPGPCAGPRTPSPLCLPPPPPPPATAHSRPCAARGQEGAAAAGPRCSARPEGTKGPAGRAPPGKGPSPPPAGASAELAQEPGRLGGSEKPTPAPRAAPDRPLPLPPPTTSSPFPAGTWRLLGGARLPAAPDVLKADLAEAAGHNPPEPAGGAAQEAAALAGEGGEVVHGGGANGRGGPWPGRTRSSARPRSTTCANFGARPRLHLKGPRRRRRRWARPGAVRVPGRGSRSRGARGHRPHRWGRAGREPGSPRCGVVRAQGQRLLSGTLLPQLPPLPRLSRLLGFCTGPRRRRSGPNPLSAAGRWMARPLPERAEGCRP